MAIGDHAPGTGGTPSATASAYPLPTTASAPLLKPAEVAQRLGVSRSWLYEAAKEGRIPSIRLGGDEGPLRFHEGDLAAWIASARQCWQPGDTTADTLRRVRDQRPPSSG